MVTASFEWTSKRDLRDQADALSKLQKNIVDELEKATEEIATKVETLAKKNAPVDTGRLRASIESTTERVTKHTVKALTGSNLEYAPIQEVKQPYLRPAFEQLEDEIKEIVRDALNRAADTGLF